MCDPTHVRISHIHREREREREREMMMMMMMMIMVVLEYIQPNHTTTNTTTIHPPLSLSLIAPRRTSRLPYTCMHTWVITATVSDTR